MKKYKYQKIARFISIIIIIIGFAIPANYAFAQKLVLPGTPLVRQQQYDILIGTVNTILPIELATSDYKQGVMIVLSFSSTAGTFSTPSCITSSKGSCVV